MPATCVIRNCETNKKSCTEKISTFGPPSEIGILEKWRDATGIETLRSNQRVCARHFDSKLIIKEYIKFDQNGRIIAQVPFKHARLEKGAVPSIFTEIKKNKNPVLTQANKLQYTCIDHCYAKNHKIKNLSVSTNVKDTVNKNTLTKQIISPPVKKFCDMLDTDSLEISSEFKLSQSTGFRTVKTEYCDRIFEGVDSEEPLCPTNFSLIANNRKNVIQTNIRLLQSNDACQENTKMTNNSIIREPKNVSKRIKKGYEVTEHYRTKIYGQTVTFKNSSCLQSSLLFDFDIKSISNNASETCIEIILPKPWNLSKSLIGTEEVLIFTYIVENHDLTESRHIFEKTVIIKSSREITYEIYSTKCNIIETQLPEVLNNIEELPDILKKFKDINICQGIRSIISLSWQNALSKTCIGTDLRHKDCSLLSFNSQMCRTCKMYCTSVKLNTKRWQERKTVQRVFVSKDPIEQLKLKSLQHKIKIRTKESRQLQQKLSLLKESIASQQQKCKSIR